MTLDPRHLGSLAVDVSTTGATSIERDFAVGDGATVAGAAAALAQGALAGMAAARELGFACDAAATASAERRLAKAKRFQEACWSLSRAPPVPLDHLPDETMICRCENLDLGDVRRTIADGAAGVVVLKHRLRLGMGCCQGRCCLPAVAHLLTEKSSPSSLTTAPRLPVKPFPARALALEKAEWGGHGGCRLFGRALGLSSGRRRAGRRIRRRAGCVRVGGMLPDRARRGVGASCCSPTRIPSPLSRSRPGARIRSNRRSRTAASTAGASPTISPGWPCW